MPRSRLNCAPDGTNRLILQRPGLSQRVLYALHKRRKNGEPLTLTQLIRLGLKQSNIAAIIVVSITVLSQEQTYGLSSVRLYSKRRVDVLQIMWRESSRGTT